MSRTHEPVEEDEVLFRLVHPSQVIDGNITSGSFRSTHKDGVSFYSGKFKTAESLRAEFPSLGLVSVTGADVAASGAKAERDITDPAHVLVSGPGSFPSKLKLKAVVLALPPASQ